MNKTRIVYMGLTVEIQNIGDASLQAEIRAVVEHVLDGRPGDWRVSLIGSRDNDQWELRITGPNEFERLYMLDGAAGEHNSQVMGGIMGRILPAKNRLTVVQTRSSMRIVH